MLGMKIEWNEAKRLYEAGIITTSTLEQCGLDYINEVNKSSDTRDEAFQRAIEVDAYMDALTY